MKRKAKYKMKEAGVFLYHIDCPQCGADAGSLYEHDDGSYSFTCFSDGCGHSVPDFDINTYEAVEKKDRYEMSEETEVKSQYTIEQVRDEFVPADLEDRKIPEAILEEYGVRVDYDENGEICKHFYPTYREDSNTKLQHVGYRIRSRFEEHHKEVKKKPELLGKMKCFAGKVGDTKKGISMFGAWLFSPENTKRIIIMEGEIDAMNARLVLKQKAKERADNYATVSMPSGANIAGIKENLDYISKFEEIYLCLDNDKAGAELLEKALKILPVGKVHVMRYPEGVKDLNEMWQSAKGSSGRKKVADIFYNMIWEATKYCPAGVRSFSEGFNALRDRGNVSKVPFPASFGDLNEKTYGGYGLGEITTIAAASSVGKSAFTREMIYTAWEETDFNIGVIPLEDTYEELMEMLIGVHLSEQINEIPFDQRDWEKIKKAHSELSKDNRIHIVDHQGAVDAEKLLELIEFMVCGLDCKIIILDPVTLALSRSDTDEDEVLSEILGKVKRHKYAHVNVCHVRKNGSGSKANSEGGDISEEDIKGSGAYFQISMNNILLTRNKVHPNPVIRNTTTIKLSKCRRHGKNTGIAGWTYYNGDTGRLEYGTDPAKLEELDQIGGGDEDEGWA